MNAQGCDPESDRRDGPDRAAWMRWGPYLSERQWGTVREDLGHDGNSWVSLPHDHARSRAYRFGEDGIAGFSDDHARLCLALALWNGRDPILKERFFGLANEEGNHGEDVKEYWFYTDATPTSSYCSLLYKYPQAEYPYLQLVEAGHTRTRTEPELELLDTGVFDEDRYFDVVVEYAKAAPEDIVMRITATNRGPEAAPLHLLPTLWLRNTWTGVPAGAPGGPATSPPLDPARPRLRASGGGSAAGPRVRVGVGDQGDAGDEGDIGPWILEAESGGEPLVCENETNTSRIYGTPSSTPYPTDGINDHVVHGAPSVNPDLTGTKAAVHYVFDVPAGATVGARLHLHRPDAPPLDSEGMDSLVALRREEADRFYAGITGAGPGRGTGAGVGAAEAAVSRQALAGMLWGRQYFSFPAATWMNQRGTRPFVDHVGRNADWPHLRADHVISMPDPWEYPWFAAWDLAFQTIPLGLVDMTAAKEQLELLLSEDYLHPNGQIPAYEWDFDDVNPPVHAWAALYLYQLERLRTGTGDTDFLARCFQVLTLNFTWWVNRKDAEGRNLFEGGFLGLDNIGVFDRSSPLPTGGRLEQADATAWMAIYSLVMAKIASILAAKGLSQGRLTTKFLEHYMWIASEVYGTERGASLWDDADGFFYDALVLPHGERLLLRVRSLVGLLPLAASETFPVSTLDAVPHLRAHIGEFVRDFSTYLPLVRHLRAPNEDGVQILSLVDEHRLRLVLSAMLDEEEFLSPHGIRSLSRRHAAEPYTFHVGQAPYTVGYVPGDSDSPMFGGNSNWRGPVWFPMNIMLIHGLLALYRYYGDSFTVECPTGSGVRMTLREVAAEVSRRLISIFLPDANGDRPVNGGDSRWRSPHWCDHVLFYEYFHGDDGHGVGASHQTGWTGLVATLIDLLGTPGALGGPGDAGA